MAVPAAAARRAESIRRALAGFSVRRPTKRETAALNVIEDMGNLQMRKCASAEHNRPDSSFMLPASRVEHSRSRAKSRAQRQAWRGDVDVKVVSRREGSITVFGQMIQVRQVLHDFGEGVQAGRREKDMPDLMRSLHISFLPQNQSADLGEAPPCASLSRAKYLTAPRQLLRIAMPSRVSP